MPTLGQFIKGFVFEPIEFLKGMWFGFRLVPSLRNLPPQMRDEVVRTQFVKRYGEDACKRMGIVN